MRLKAAIFAYCPQTVSLYATRLRSDSLGARLARGTFWSVVGSLLARAFGLFASVLVARALGKVQFGELGIIQSTISLFGLFAGFGMGLTATKYVAEFRSSDQKRVAGILSDTALFSWVSSGVLALCLFVCAPWLASHTLAAPHLSGPLRWTTPLLFLTGWQGAQLGALAGFEAFKKIAQLSALSGLVNFPLVVGGALLWGLNGVIWGAAVAQFVSCGLNSWAIRKTASEAGVILNFRPKVCDFRLMWGFSFPALISGAMVVPVNWLCNAILVNQPSGYAEMGLLNAASQWRSAILFLPSIVSSVSLPLLAGLRGSSDSTRATRLVWNGLRLNAGTALLAVLGISLSSPLIMSSYGMASARANLTLILLCFSAWLSGTIGVMGQYITSRGMMWWGTFLNMIWGCALVSAAWKLRNLGALGMAWANLIAYAIHLSTVGCFTLRFLPRSNKNL
jgi:O-antigen/teichoic acid export membrane protein